MQFVAIKQDFLSKNFAFLCVEGNEMKIYPQYKYYVENLREQITQREKYLKNINDNELYIELACDQDKFTNWINKKYMDLSKEEFNKKQIGINNKEISLIVKENELLNKINACFWFEDLLKFPRYKIEDIKCNDVESIKKVFEKNTETFYAIFKNNECEHKTMKSIKYKIKSIINENYLQKFIADCYNMVVDNVILYKYKQKKISGKLEGIYHFEKQ